MNPALVLPTSGPVIERARDPIAFLADEIESMKLDHTLKAHLILHIRPYLPGYQKNGMDEKRAAVATYLTYYTDMVRCRHELATLDRSTPKARTVAAAMRASGDSMFKALRAAGLGNKTKKPNSGKNAAGRTPPPARPNRHDESPPADDGETA